MKITQSDMKNHPFNHQFDCDRVHHLTADIYNRARDREPDEAEIEEYQRLQKSDNETISSIQQKVYLTTHASLSDIEKDMLRLDALLQEQKKRTSVNSPREIDYSNQIEQCSALLTNLRNKHIEIKTQLDRKIFIITAWVLFIAVMTLLFTAIAAYNSFNLK